MVAELESKCPVNWETKVILGLVCSYALNDIGDYFLSYWRYTLIFIYYIFVIVQSLRCVWLFVTPWTVAHQTPLWYFPDKIREWVAIFFSRREMQGGIGWFSQLNSGLTRHYAVSRRRWGGTISTGKVWGSERFWVGMWAASLLEEGTWKPPSLIPFWLFPLGLCDTHSMRRTESTLIHRGLRFPLFLS